MHVQNVFLFLAHAVFNRTLKRNCLAHGNHSKHRQRLGHYLFSFLIQFLRLWYWEEQPGHRPHVELHCRSVYFYKLRRFADNRWINSLSS